MRHECCRNQSANVHTTAAVYTRPRHWREACSQFTTRCYSVCSLCGKLRDKLTALNSVFSYCFSTHFSSHALSLGLPDKNGDSFTHCIWCDDFVNFNRISGGFRDVNFDFIGELLHNYIWRLIWPFQNKKNVCDVSAHAKMKKKNDAAVKPAQYRRTMQFRAL